MSRYPENGVGLRDKNKAEKRRRITEAARYLFAKRGYEGTTLREIAERAGVALGTLSLYADDKRDLVLLIFNDEIPELIDTAMRRNDSGKSLLEQLCDFFGVFYRHYGKEAKLYVLFLRENIFRSTGRHGPAFRDNRRKVIDCVQSIIDNCKRNGEAGNVRDTAEAARLIFFIYFASVRWWIVMPTPDPKRGIADLRSLIELTISGLNGAAAPSRA